MVTSVLVIASVFSVLLADEDDFQFDGLSLVQKRADIINSASRVRAPGTCTDLWGTFGETPLTKTQLIKQTSNVRDPPPMDRDLFVDESSNFAFCRIQKVGSTQWDIVLQKVLKHDSKKGHGWNEETYDVVDIAHKKYGQRALENVFKDPSATRAVFVRDPISRFASAFLDKCFCENCTQRQCIMRPDDDAGKPVSMRDAVDWAVGLGPTGYAKEVTNIHWVLQSEHCDLKNSIDQFTVIGYYDKEHVSQDAACVMKLAGIEQYNVPSKLESKQSTYWQESASRKSTAHGGTRLGYTGADGTSDDSLLGKLFTKEAAEKMFDFFAQDYDTFHFPKPAWIAHATGEWYEEAPDATCSSKADSSKTSTGSVSATPVVEEEDIEEPDEEDRPSADGFKRAGWGLLQEHEEYEAEAVEDRNDIGVLVGRAGYSRA